MYSSLIPYAAYTNFTPALPEFYWNVYSAEQRIKHICFELCKLHAYSDYLSEQIAELGEDVEIEIKEIREEVEKKQQDFRNEIIRLIEELDVGDLQWDVQHGRYTDSVNAQRDMFNDVTVHSYNNEQLEKIFDDLDMSVDDLANCGLNVKGYAIMNHLILEPIEPTNDLIPEAPSREGKYTVADLINSALDKDGYIFVERN